jgi:peptidoglycan/LPS O-acetylase OafA/YrhL
MFYFITSLGHQAVVIFFVLSGFLVAGSVINQLKKDKFNLKMYFINRFSRLYAVLFIALLLTLILDHTGIHFDHIGFYTGKIKSATLGFSIADRLSLKYFLASLFMLQTIVLPPLGSNSPLWSLSYEFWYYVMFPCICLLFVYIKSRSKLLAIPVLVLMLIGIFLPKIILLYFIIWLIGLVPFWLTLKSPIYKYIFFLIFIIWLLLKRAIHIDGFYYDLVLGLIVAFLVSSFGNFEQPLDSKILKLNERLSSFSYSTYLVHFPVIMIVLTLLHNYGNTGILIEPGLPGYFIFAFVSLFALICSYAVASVTEFRTAKLRDFMKHIIFRTKGER